MACDPTVDHMTLRVCFRSDRVWVTSAQCRPPHPGPLAERALTAHALVLPRRGVFVRHHGEEGEVGDANHAVFFNAGEPYRTSHPGGGGDDCDVVTILPDVLTELLSNLGVREGFGVRTHATDPRVYLAQRALFARLSRTPPADASQAERVVLALVTRIVTDAHRARVVRRVRTTPSRSGHHTKWVEHVQRLLAERYREGPTLDALATEVGCSAFHLCRLFKRHTGLSIHRYLNRLRLRVALTSIAESDARLADLADDLGYSSHSHFTDAFRREFGVTPTAARRLVLTAELPVIESLLEASATPAQPPRATRRVPEPALAGVGARGADLDNALAFRGQSLDPRPRAYPLSPPHAA